MVLGEFVFGGCFEVVGVLDDVLCLSVDLYDVFVFLDVLILFVVFDMGEVVVCFLGVVVNVIRCCWE